MSSERYYCTNCETTFDHETTLEGGGKPRCPGCLRHNGLEPAVERAERAAASLAVAGRAVRSRRLWVALAVLVFGGAAVAGGVLLLRRHEGDVPRPGQLAVLDADDLARTLRQRGVPEGKLVDPFRGSAAVSKLAAAGAGKRGAGAARAIAAGIGKRLAKVEVLLTELGRTPIRDAATLAGALAAGKVERATSFELAALVAAALRARGDRELAAVICEVHRLEGTRVRSADVTGALGRYLVAVYPAEAPGGKPLVVLDPARAARLPAWAGGGGDVKMAARAGKLHPLDDGSASAHMMSQMAQVASRHGRARSAEAYELSRLALAAGAPSATLRLARALVLAGAGGVKDAVGEAERAVQRRGDPPRRTAWARLLLASGDGAKAQKQLAAALKEDPSFWPALITAATLRWITGKRDEGDELLAKARAVAPEEPAVLALAAERKLGGGEVAEGLALLQRAAEREPAQAGVLLKLYLTLRKLGRKQQAAEIEGRLLAAAPDRDEVERAIKAIDEAEQRAAAATDKDTDKDTEGGAGAQDSKGGAGGAAPPPPPPPPMPKQLKLPDVTLGK